MKWDKSTIKILLAGMIMVLLPHCSAAGPPFLFLGDSPTAEEVAQGQALEIPIFVGSGRESGSQIGEVLLGFFVTQEEGANATGQAFCLDPSSPDGWTFIGDSFDALQDCTPISNIQFPHHLFAKWRAIPSVSYSPGTLLHWLACSDSVVDGHVTVAFVEGDDTFCTEYFAKIIQGCSGFDLLLDGTADPTISFDDIYPSSPAASKTIEYSIVTNGGVSDDNSSNIELVSKPAWLKVEINSTVKTISFAVDTSYFTGTQGQQSQSGLVRFQVKNKYCAKEKAVPVSVTVLAQQSTSSQNQSSSSSQSSGLINTTFNKNLSFDFAALLTGGQSSSKLYVYQSAKASVPDNDLTVDMSSGEIYEQDLYVRNKNGQLVSNLSYSDDQTWMRVSKVSTGRLRVRIDGANFNPGSTYSGTITITDKGTGAKETVHVSVRVAGVCDEALATIRRIQDVAFSLKEGGSTQSETVSVKDSCGNPLEIQSLSVSPSVKWLDYTQGTSSIQFTASPSGLSSGYSDQVTVTVNTAKGTETFTVSVSVQAKVTITTTKSSTGIIKTVTLPPGPNTYVKGFGDTPITLKPGQGILYSFTSSVPDSSNPIIVTLQPNSVSAGGSGDANAYIKIGSKPTISEVTSGSSSLISRPRSGTIAEQVYYDKPLDETTIYVLIYNPGTESDTFRLSITYN